MISNLKCKKFMHSDDAQLDRAVYGGLEGQIQLLLPPNNAYITP